MSEPTGRRRCQIAEHRRQIRYLQRWTQYLQAGQYANWEHARRVEAELRAERAEHELTKAKLVALQQELARDRECVRNE